MLEGLLSFVVSILARIALGAFSAWRSEREAKAAGRAEAVAEAGEVARATTRTARAVEDEAAARHRADPSDAAFDQEFKRR